jgi:hypothetical protein
MLSLLFNQALQVTGVGIGSTEAFGTGSLALRLAGNGIASGEAFGTDAERLQLAGQGIASAEAFGTGAARPAIAGIGVASAESFGMPAARVTLAGSGIDSAEAFGAGDISFPEAPQVLPEPTIAWVSRRSGRARITAPTAPLVLQGIGIPSAEAFGVGTVVLGASLELRGQVLRLRALEKIRRRDDDDLLLAA